MEMEISDNKRKHLLKIAFVYLLITLFCVLFGAVYEIFGHGVYSYRMIYAFTAPLVLGVLCLSGIALRAKRLPGSGSLLLWNFGTATLTTGLFFHGVLEIYGTTSRWTFVYYIAAGVLLCAGILSFVITDRKKNHP